MRITIVCFVLLLKEILGNSLLHQELYDNILHIKVHSSQPIMIQFRDHEMIQKEGNIRCHYCKCISKYEQFEFIGCSENSYILQWKTTDQYLEAYFAEKQNPLGKHLIHHNYESRNNSTQVVDITDMQSFAQSDHIKLFWKFNANQTFDMVVIWDQLTWLGLSFDPGMQDTDFMAFEIVNNTLHVSDWYSECYCYPELDQQQDIKMISYQLTDKGFTARVQRKLNTNDIKDKVLIQGEQYQFGYVFSDEQKLTFHYYDNSLNINFTSGVSTVNSQQGYLMYLLIFSIYL